MICARENTTDLAQDWVKGYRATSTIINSAPLGLYGRTMPRALWKPEGGGCFLRARYPCRKVDVRLPGKGMYLPFKRWMKGYLEKGIETPMTRGRCS